jgi:hypothetical protein
MDYSRELQKIEDFVRSEYYRDAARNCGSILEAVLKDIYRKVRANAAAAVSMKLIEVEDRLSKGRDGFQSFMLGQLVGLFREARVFDRAESTLGVSCRLSKRLPLDELTEIRNRCTHDHEYAPTLEELNFFLSSLRVLLHEFGYLPGGFSPPPTRVDPEETLRAELAEIRMQMLSGGTGRDLQEAFYKIENVLHRHPSHPEALNLKGQLARAASYEWQQHWPQTPMMPQTQYVSPGEYVGSAKPLRRLLIPAAVVLALASLAFIVYLLVRRFI